MTPRPGETAPEIAARYGAVARCDVTVCPPRTFSLSEYPAYSPATAKLIAASQKGNEVHKARSRALFDRIRDAVVAMHEKGHSHQQMADALGVLTHSIRRAKALLGLTSRKPGRP